MSWNCFLNPLYVQGLLHCAKALDLAPVYFSFPRQHWSKTHRAVHINKFNYQKSYFNLNRRIWSSLMFYSSCHNKWFRVSWIKWVGQRVFSGFSLHLTKKPEQTFRPTQYFMIQNTWETEKWRNSLEIWIPFLWMAAHSPPIMNKFILPPFLFHQTVLEMKQSPRSP